MALRLDALCFDAHDPAGLARFWAEALRWEVDGGSPDGTALVATDGTRFGIRFRPVAGQKLVKNRVHLDLTTTTVEDQEDTVATLVERGARPVDIGQGPDVRHVVLADPEGNEFCVIEPENAFLADCGRLGSITWDGTPAVGLFWSRTLGWPLVWDRDDETAVRAPDGTGPFITWGPPVPAKTGTNRLHLELAPPGGVEQQAVLDHLTGLGATPLHLFGGDARRVFLADPDGNEFGLLRP